MIPVNEMGPFLRIMMLGVRGIPDVQGGVETHCQQLSRLLVKMNCEVTVLTRSPYQPKNIGSVWENVKIVTLWAPKAMRFEAVVHTFLGVLYAAIKRPDILHIHAIGPGLMTPLARILGLKVVVTHHGMDYERQKWGGFARFVLKLGERWAMLYANKRIVISKVIDALMREKYNVSSELIHNGVVMSMIPDSIGALDKFALKRKQYVLLVSRLVPEKRHLDLVAAFQQADVPDWKLVLVGEADHANAYQDKLAKKAAEAGVVMTGFQSGLALQELFAHAGLFVLPSSHEGLPIVLLEALSYGLFVLASDIPANLEVGLPARHYFPLGNVEALAKAIKQWSNGLSFTESESIRMWVTKNYDWRKIAEKTLQLYIKV